MFCSSCKRSLPDQASHCGYCGTELEQVEPRTGGFRSDHARTIADRPIADRPLAGGEQGRRSSGRGWPDGPLVRNPLHDTIPHYAIETVVASEDELSAALASMRTSPEGAAARGEAPAPRGAASASPLKTLPCEVPLTRNDESPQRMVPTAPTRPWPVGGATLQPQTSEVTLKTKPAEARAIPPQGARGARKAQRHAQEGAARPGPRFMRLLMALFGLLLLVAFFLPYLQSGSLPWAQAGAPGGSARALASLPFARLVEPVAGLILILVALVPLPHPLRAAIALTLGSGAIAAAALRTSADWRHLVTLAALVVLPAALLCRARERRSVLARSVLARVLVLLGGAALLALPFVPTGGSMPLVQMLRLLSPPLERATGAFPLLLIALSLASLATLIGARRALFPRFWALCLLAYLPARTWLDVAFSVYTAEEAIKTQLGTILTGVSTFIFLTLAAYGAAQLIWQMSGAAQPARTGRPNELGAERSAGAALTGPIGRSPSAA